MSESLNTLEDQDLDALMADLVADISEAEQRTIQAQKESSQSPYPPAPPEVSHFSGTASPGYGANVVATSMSQYEDALPPPPADPMLDLPLPPPPPEPLSQVSAWPEMEGPLLPIIFIFFKARVTFISLYPKTSEIVRNKDTEYVHWKGRVL